MKATSQWALQGLVAKVVLLQFASSVPYNLQAQLWIQKNWNDNHKSQIHD
jgi:hypothetical protein